MVALPSNFDIEEIQKHYDRLNDEKHLSAKSFVAQIMHTLWEFEAKTGKDAIFQKYIDGETHLAFKKIGFEDPHGLWGERYGLTQEAYNAVRSVTLEKFVKKAIESRKAGKDMDDAQTYLSRLN